ncbi:MAG: hypothetical protein RLZZ187_3845, partial [Pseudomonadota bacterium]
MSEDRGSRRTSWQGVAPMGRSLTGTLLPDAGPGGYGTDSEAPTEAAAQATRALIEHAFVLMLLGGLVLGVLMVLQPLATAILFGAVLAIATWPLRSALLRLGLGHGAA